MDKKQDLTLCCLQKYHFKHKDRDWLKIKGWKKIGNTEPTPKKAEVALLKAKLASDKKYYQWQRGLLHNEKQFNFPSRQKHSWFYAYKFDSLEQMDKFPKKHILTKITQEEIQKFK